jgi:hypothetical protein
MPNTLREITAIAAGTVFATSASAQSARDIRGPSPLVAIENEAPARLIRLAGADAVRGSLRWATNIRRSPSPIP